MEALLEEGADLNETLNGRTALMVAAGSNPNPAVIGFLLENGADVAATDKEGATALDYAKNNKALHGTEAMLHLMPVATQG